MTGGERSLAVARSPRRRTGAFSDTGDHELVQRRLALTYRLFALILAGVFVLVTLVASSFSPQRAVALEGPQLAYLGAVVAVTVAWLLCRGRTLPLRALSLIDGGSLFALVALVSLAATYAPAELRLEHLNATLFAIVVMS